MRWNLSGSLKQCFNAEGIYKSCICRKSSYRTSGSTGSAEIILIPLIPASVCNEALWKAAKDRQRLQNIDIQPFVVAVDSPANKPILFVDLDPATLSEIDWDVFVALFNALEAVKPDMTYSFQTKLDRLE